MTNLEQMSLSRTKRPSLMTIISRGWNRRCPHCGKGKLFRKRAKLYDICPACGVKHLENNGDFWGFLLILDRASLILPLIILIYFDLLPKTDWLLALFFIAIMAIFIATTDRRYGLSVGLDYFSRYYWGNPPKVEASTSV